MSINIKENGILKKIIGTLVRANWNDRLNINKSSCIENQPPTLKNIEEISANTDENALAGAVAVKEVYDSLQNENNESFNFGYKDGVRGFFTNPSRADDSFIPFKGEPTFVIAEGFRLDEKPYTFTESGTYLIISINFYNSLQGKAEIAYSDNANRTFIAEGYLSGVMSSFGSGRYAINILDVNVGDKVGSEDSSSVGLIILKL